MSIVLRAAEILRDIHFAGIWVGLF